MNDMVTLTVIHEHDGMRIIESWKIDIETAVFVKFKLMGTEPVARTIFPVGVDPTGIANGEFTEWPHDK